MTARKQYQKSVHESEKHPLALPENDLGCVRGQWHVKRALEVTAAGGHSLLLTGSPDVGKAMLARTLPTLLPHVPHFLFTQPQPDEEFVLDKDVVNMLFLRDIHLWKVRDLTRLWGEIGRVAGTVQIVGTFQPCPCGYHNDPLIECPCPAQRIIHHHHSKSPFLNCFDINVQVPRPEADHLVHPTFRGESSEAVRTRVEKAREWRRQRLGVEGPMNPALDRALGLAQEEVTLDASGVRLLQAAVEQLSITPRAMVHLLYVARTIADLAGAENVSALHIAEAVQYQPRHAR